MDNSVCLLLKWKMCFSEAFLILLCEEDEYYHACTSSVLKPINTIQTDFLNFGVTSQKRNEKPE